MIKSDNKTLRGFSRALQHVWMLNKPVYCRVWSCLLTVWVVKKDSMLTLSLSGVCVCVCEGWLILCALIRQYTTGVQPWSLISLAQVRLLKPAHQSHTLHKNKHYLSLGLQTAVRKQKNTGFSLATFRFLLQCVSHNHSSTHFASDTYSDSSPGGRLEFSM